MKQYNKKKVLKGLNCCAIIDCDKCPYHFVDCSMNLAEDALMLIGSQTEDLAKKDAEIEKLEKKNADLQSHLTQLKLRYDNAKADIASLNEKVDFVGNLEDIRKEIEVEAYKKFAEDLKDKLVEVSYDTGEFEYYVYDVTDTHIAIDELVKAKTEGRK